MKPHEDAPSTDRERRFWLARLFPALAAFAAIAALIGSPGCITGPEPDIPRDAIVTYDTVKLQYADEGGGGGGPGQVSPDLGTLGQPLVGDQSDVRALTLATVVHANLLMAGTLLAVETISKFPPAETSDSRWVWQGDDDDVFTRFRLTQESATTFAYQVDRRLVGESEDALQAVFDGGFEPLEGNSADDRVRSGQGTLRFHLTENQKYVPSDPAGDVALSFRSSGGVRQVHVLVRDLVEESNVGEGNAEARNAAYRFEQLPDRSGAFQFTTDTNFVKEGAALERVSVHTRWDGDGAGRARVFSSGGDTPAGGLTADECWDESGVTVWLDTTPDLPGFEGGDESACAESLRGVELEDPQLEVTLTDPPIPSPHPAEE